MQNTNHVLMIRPSRFTYNEQTAINNAFQSAGYIEDAQEKALMEFDAFVEVLKENGVDVTVVNDTAEPHTPDSVFPNNWVSFHNDTIVLYPMFAINRRAERKTHVLEAIESKFGTKKRLDFTEYENLQLYLEGTGSMVLDRENKIAYACLSARTNQNILNDFCTAFGYEACVFHALDEHETEIYHTNVMMCVGSSFAVVCISSIKEEERQKVIKNLKKNGKTIIEISFEQMNRFAGNMLELQSDKGEPLIIMSQQAYSSLTINQINTLAAFGKIVSSDIHTIETSGGGSARCMIAEIFL